MTNPLLELNEVHVAYVQKEILHGVSLFVKRGEVVALLGGNGSGKSTTLKTIAGLLQPTRGRVLFDGCDISQEPVHRRQRRGIGYLMQGGRVFPNLTVAENLAVAAAHATHDLQGAPSLGSIFPALTQRARDRAGLLSGGQRQMLALEMSMAQHARLLLLDEPTGGLAPNLCGQIIEELVKKLKLHGWSALIVEQNVGVVKEFCDRSYHLKDGTIVVAPVSIEPTEQVHPYMTL